MEKTHKQLISMVYLMPMCITTADVTDRNGATEMIEI